MNVKNLKNGRVNGIIKFGKSSSLKTNQHDIDKQLDQNLEFPNFEPIHGSEIVQNLESINLDSDKLIKLKSAITKLNKEQANLSRSKLILETVEENIESGTMMEGLCDKVKTTLLLSSSDLCLGNGDSEMTNLLGLSAEMIEDENQLTQQEKAILRAETETRIKVFCTHFDGVHEALQYDGLLKYAEQIVGPETLFSDHQLQITQLQRELLKKMDTRKHVLSDIYQLHQQLGTLKVNALHSATLRSITSIEESAEEIKCKARLVHHGAESAFLSQDVNMIEALCLLHERVSKQVEEASIQLKRLDSKLNDYKQLDNTDFPEILKQYIKTKKALTHWQWTLDELSELDS